MAIFMGGTPVKEMVFSRFYDFDCCGWGYRAYDLAVFPWAFAVRQNTTDRIEAMGRAFLKGYIRRRTLGSTDVDAIAAFVAIRQIWLFGLHIGAGDRFGWGWINEDYFDRQFKVLRDWGEELAKPTRRGVVTDSR
jgi:Ser/Thr protein kinase RdoA (MazF antagonist)